MATKLASKPVPPRATTTTASAAPKPSAPIAMPPVPSPANGTPSASDGIDIDLGDSNSNNRSIDIGDDGLADAEAALEAMQSFRLAEAALQRKDIAGAQKLAQKAVDGDPTQSDYVTLLAWIRSLGNTPALIDEAINTMSRVLDEDPSSERALLYRGRLFARMNRNDQALADFNELLANNPQHREAQAEVRQLKKG